jgi:trehalose-6-phosphate synthase
VFRDEEFEVYRQVNQRFTDCVADSAPAGALVWVHDYQLQLVPALLREARPDLRIGFFLHVPFPASTEFDTLPWKESILSGLLGADVVGFQTNSSAERFIDEACLRLSAIRDGRGVLLSELADKRRVTVDVFPVGPDAERFSYLAATPAVRECAARIRVEFGAPELILLGVDRLDYTKGIDVRIRAVADLLKSDEFRRRDIQFVQVAMPSRGGLAAYQRLRATVEQTLRAANVELTALGLRPIHYIYEALQTEQVVALYVAADVMLVTSLSDGMNLVSKEFVACRNEGSGSLVLSMTAGAAVQLRDAWLVDAYNVADLKRGIGDAIRAGADEARDRMGRLRQAVFNADARRWAKSFLGRLQESR